MKFDPAALEDFARWLAAVAAEEFLAELEAGEAQAPDHSKNDRNPAPPRPRR